MPNPLRPQDAHEEAEVLLPWYATGQLEPGERALVENHLESCAECKRLLALEHRMVEEFQALDPGIDSGWARLRGRIETQAPRRWPGARAAGGVWNVLRQPAVASLAAAQVAFVILAGGVLLSLSRPDYRALGSAGPSPAANVIVIFRSDATEKDVLDALRASGASLVGGPTSTDAYLLRVPANRRALALASLQADQDVQMAQPIDGPSR